MSLVFIVSREGALSSKDFNPVVQTQQGKLKINDYIILIKCLIRQLHLYIKKKKHKN